VADAEVAEVAEVEMTGLMMVGTTMVVGRVMDMMAVGGAMA